MKRFLSIFTAFFMLFLLCPTAVWAAGESGTESGVPLWLCIPFAGLLLCIAVMPLVKGEWWEAHQPLVVVLWILVMVIPFALLYGVGSAAETVLECTVNDYLTCIVLLFGLYFLKADRERFQEIESKKKAQKRKNKGRFSAR